MTFLLGLLGNGRAWGILLPAVAVALLGSAVWVQTLRLGNAQEEAERLSREIRAVRSAILLTEKLDRDNQILSQDQVNLGSDLRNADGFDTPLPDDIRAILGRLYR